MVGKLRRLINAGEIQNLAAVDPGTVAAVVPAVEGLGVRSGQVVHNRVGNAVRPGVVSLDSKAVCKAALHGKQTGIVGCRAAVIQIRYNTITATLRRIFQIE